MRIFPVSVILLPLVSAALAGVAPAATARADDAHEYVVAANDGYGLEDCLAAGSDCGRVVADAWCEAHGHGHALAYGPRGSIDGGATQVSATDDPYIIRCGD